MKTLLLIAPFLATISLHAEPVSRRAACAGAAFSSLVIADVVYTTYSVTNRDSSEVLTPQLIIPLAVSCACKGVTLVNIISLFCLEQETAKEAV